MVRWFRRRRRLTTALGRLTAVSEQNTIETENLTTAIRGLVQTVSRY